MRRPGTLRLWNLLAAVVVLGGGILAPQISPAFVTAGEDRTTATADDVVKIDADFEAGDYVWQSTTLEASNDGDLIPFHLGFVVSIATPLNLITGAGSFSRLLPGQAMAVAEGDEANVQTLTGDPAPYAAVELVPAADAEDATAPAFPLEAGNHELSLQLFRPPTGDAIEIRQLIQPILILVQSGEFTLEPLVATGTTDAAAPLGPGESASLLFDTRLRQSGDDPTAFFVATLDAPGSETDDGASAEPSAISSAATTASPVASASPSQAASPRSVTVRPSASSARPSASASPAPSVTGESPRSAPSAKSSPPEHAPVRK